jgi:hypothetical protein
MRATMLGLVFALAVAVASNALAQQAPAPPALQPLPDAPLPAPEVANPNDPELEPQVTIVRREHETIEEYRVSGRLIMVKVTPKNGRPYYLVAEGPNGSFVRRDSLDTGLRVPMWLLFSF